MRYSKQILAISLLLTATLFLTACPQRTTIGQINADPSRYHNKEVVPSRGSRVAAKGHIQTGFNFGGRSFGTVLEETDRRAEGR